MKIDREGFLAAVAALGLLAPGLSACDATEDEGADGGLGGSAGTGGESAGGDIGGAPAGGEIAGGSGGAGGGGGGAGGAGGLECEPDFFSPGVSWGEEPTDGVTLTFDCGTASGYKVGFAETGAGDDGWYGEDCLAGEKSGADLCHTVPAAGVELSHVETPDEIVEGETTLLRAELVDGITWVVISADDAAECWVGGHDPSYYDELGCAYAE